MGTAKALCQRGMPGGPWGWLGQRTHWSRNQTGTASIHPYTSRNSCFWQRTWWKIKNGFSWLVHYDDTSKRKYLINSRYLPLDTSAQSFWPILSTLPTWHQNAFGIVAHMADHEDPLSTLLLSLPNWTSRMATGACGRQPRGCMELLLCAANHILTARYCWHHPGPTQLLANGMVWIPTLLLRCLKNGTWHDKRPNEQSITPNAYDLKDKMMIKDVDLWLRAVTMFTNISSKSSWMTLLPLHQ